MPRLDFFFDCDFVAAPTTTSAQVK
eukprot:COSAG02_NODE_82549_length_102_cov_248.333333_1_plen_24_part_01